MILEIKGFAIPTDKICSISPIKVDDRKRFTFSIQLVNGNIHNLVYSTSRADADTARMVAIKALEGETIDIVHILKQVKTTTQKISDDIAQKAIDELLKELGVKDVDELKKKIK